MEYVASCLLGRAVIINFIKAKNKNYTHRTNKNSNEMTEGFPFFNGSSQPAYGNEERKKEEEENPPRADIDHHDREI